MIATKHKYGWQGIHTVFNFVVCVLYIYIHMFRPLNGFIYAEFDR